VVALERKVRRKQSFLQNRQNPPRMKYWEIIADNLSKAGWSWGCVSAVDSNGRTIWIADALSGDGRPAIELAVRCDATFVRNAGAASKRVRQSRERHPPNVGGSGDATLNT